jgi:phage gp45-like/microcystin-dependent protein
MIERLYWAVKRIIGRGRGVVESDVGPVQLVQLQLSDLEITDQLPRIAEYGFQSCPPDGFTGVALFFGGDHSSGVVIATQHQSYRFQPLAKGEVALSDNIGQSVYLSATGVKVTDKAGSTVVLNGVGAVTLTDKAGSTVVLNGVGAVTLTAPQINLNASTQVEVTSPWIDLSSWAGIVVAWPTSAAVPAGWLVCPTVQTLVSTTTYARLFAVIGYTWGGGGGSFGIPYYAAGYVPIQGTPGALSHGVVIDHVHNYSYTPPQTAAAGGGTPNSGGNYNAATTTPNTPQGGQNNLAAGMGVQFIVKY